MNNVKVPEKIYCIHRNCADCFMNKHCEEEDCEEIYNLGLSEGLTYHRHVLVGIKEDFKKISMISDRKYCISIINEALKKLEGE